MYIKKTSDKLINMLIIFTIFDAYSIFFIKDFTITVGIFIIGIVCILKIIDFKNFRIGYKYNLTNKVAYIMIIYCMFNFLINNGKITSLVYTIFFLTFLILSYRQVEESEFERIIDIYIYITSILSIYAIYQFLGRSYGWPLSNLYYEPIMQKGYNWSNSISFGGKIFFRANAIYKEPSLLSQYTALSICFLYIKFWNEKNKVFLILIVIDMIAIILSFAGTGILVLLVFFTFRIFSWIKSHKRKFNLKNCLFIFFIICITILSIKIFQNNIYLQTFLNRKNEIFSNTSSGGIRFVGPFIALRESLQNNFFLGNGIGNRLMFIENLRLGISTVSSQSTLPRVGIDLGIIGLINFLLILFSLLLFDKRKNLNNKYYFTIALFCFIQLFNGEYFLSVTYWAFVYFINIKINLKNYNNNCDILG
ncbi:hypothetical protein CLHOM_07220 [Clostridium homopropionicum DSM 5847]|uniref:O-antigen ligase n=1 Tax=Clostridium homopropionicum DSM 5847 TaxID=1121318 RepID=A0A0L6ZC86_9CLOT|nr:hypothetical protein [Clostridium homopropionicum]KOA20580.1 hypothetical protein CLHOM_07220 [Clostridium homopropionicum DSM 5847]SFF93930.1 hypothetical protein SAMN04488501_103281 [Clostridium homopropionicum]